MGQGLHSRSLCWLAALSMLGCGDKTPAQSSGDAEPGSQVSPGAEKAGTKTGAVETGDQKDGGTDPKKPESSSDDEDPGEEEGTGPSPKFDLGAMPSNKPDGDDCDCKPNAELIFLWGVSGNLWMYNPAKSGDEAFKKLGKPDCPTGPGQYAFSMGVDRQANAWLTVRPSGKMFKVDTLNNNACEQSKFKPGTKGFTLFGMAFVEHPNDGQCEQLYMHSLEGDEAKQGPKVGKLGVFNPETEETKLISRINYSGGELTGTRDGRLFAFAGLPGRLLEYDPKTGAVKKETPLGNLELGAAFAFAFWGGDFYFFTDSPSSLLSKSKVTKLDYDGDGSLTTVIETAPLRVAGAGVSICAPLDPPK